MEKETILSSIVPHTHAGNKLADYLAGRFRYYDRIHWAAFITDGVVTVNGDTVPPDYRIRSRDLVAFRTVLNEPPVNRDLVILHEEAGFLIAMKPGNLPSHGNGNYITHTAIFLLRELLGEHGFTDTLHLVHRLDRETSGLLVAAKQRSVHRELARQFETGAVEKEYLAVVRGVMTEERLNLDGAIGRDPESSISVRFAVLPGGGPDSRNAATDVVVERRLAGYTLVRCRPRTGRTNQIRVHLAHAGHPLAGDKLYGRTDEEFLRFVNLARAGDHGPYPWLDAPRHLLHAASLRFTHPVTGEPFSITAPMPGDMADFIAAHGEASA